MLLNNQTKNLDAYARLATRLCEAMTQFLTDTATGPSPLERSTVAANDNEAAETRDARWPHDPMTLKEVQYELRLKEAQIVKLRRLWAFPSPIHRGGKLLFSRREIERWVRAQPNASNLAAVLRMRRRHFLKLAE